MEQQNQQTPPQEQPSPSSSKNFLANPKLPFIVAAVAIILAVGGVLLLKSYVPGQMGERSTQAICEWQPSEEDYGPCALVLGVYFNGENCVPVSGCDSGEDAIPFGYGELEQCQSLCEGTTISPQPRELDTSTWQTYRNDEFGFAVRYPREWEVRESVLKENFGLAFEIINPKSGSALSIGNNENTETLSLDEWFRKTTVVNGRPTIKASAKPVVINGLRAYRLDNELSPPNPLFEIYIANEHNAIFTLFAHSENMQDSKVLDQILSTFRFVETPKNSPDVLETGPQTYCKSNEDCWCREFTGAGYGPRRIPWSCNLGINRCEQCSYL